MLTASNHHELRQKVAPDAEYLLCQGMHVDNEGVAGVVEQLMKGKVTRLNLENNKITEKGANVLADLLTPKTGFEIKRREMLSQAVTAAREISDFMKSTQLDILSNMGGTLERVLAAESSQEVQRILQTSRHAVPSEQWESGIVSKIQSTSSHEKALDVLSTIKAHFEEDKHKALSAQCCSLEARTFTDALRAQQLKQLTRSSLTMDYILYCLTFYHNTKEIAEAVKEGLTNQINKDSDETFEELKLMFVTRLRDAVHQNSLVPKPRSVVAKPSELLTVLKLSNNMIGDAGAEHLAETLLYNTILKKLFLSRCSISDTGAESLSHSLLTCNSTLSALDLSSNVITDSGAVALMEIFQENTAVHTLRVDGNMITPELEGLLEKCTERNKKDGTIGDRDSYKRMAKCVRAATDTSYSRMSGSGSYLGRNDTLEVEDPLLQIRTLLLLGKTAKALSSVEELLENPAICPSGAQRCAAASAPPQTLESVLPSWFPVSPASPESLSTGPPAPASPIPPGKPRPVKNKKFIPFYSDPIDDYERFINSWSECNFTPTMSRYRLFEAAKKAWKEADWVKRTSMIGQKYRTSEKPDEGKESKTPKEAPFPPTPEVEPATCVTLYPTSASFVSKGRVVTICIEDKHLVVKGLGKMNIKVVEPMAYDVGRMAFAVPHDKKKDGYIDVPMKEDDLAAAVVAHVARLGRSIDNPLKIIEDERPESTEAQILHNGDAVVPFYKTVLNNDFTFKSNDEEVHFWASGKDLRYSVNNFNRNPFTVVHFNGVDTLEFDDTSNLILKKKLLLYVPLEALLEVLGKLRCMCKLAGVSHDIPERIDGYRTMVETKKTMDQQIAEREAALLTRRDEVEKEAMSVEAIENIGSKVDCSKEVALEDVMTPVAPGKSPSSPRVFRLELVPVPIMFSDAFSFLSQVVLFGFMEVFSRQSDFKTQENRVLALTDSCIYLYHLGGNIEYCLEIARIDRLLVGQDEGLSLHIAIVTKRESQPPTHDLMLTGSTEHMKKLIRLLRATYSIQTDSRLSLSQLPDTANLHETIILSPPSGYTINHIQPTPR